MKRADLGRKEYVELVKRELGTHGDIG